MSGADFAALVAGIGVLLMAFASFQFASQALLNGRMRVFVRRGVMPRPVAVRRAQKVSRVAFVEDLNRRLRQANYARRVQKDLIRAGLDMQSSRFLVLQGIIASIVFTAIWYATALVPDLKGFPGLLLALVGGVVTWFIPTFVLKFLESQRLKKLERQLPPTIDSMAGALQAGSSLPQAMEMASREVSAPIGEELAIVVREMAVGVPMADAFANMLDRSRSLDLDMLVTAITIQHRIGGNLSQILRTISHTIRERLRIKGEINVLTAQQRMSGYVVSALPLIIVIALFVIAPDYIIKLFQPGIARIMLGMGLIGMAAGFFALKKIAEIEV